MIRPNRRGPLGSTPRHSYNQISSRKGQTAWRIHVTARYIRFLFQFQLCASYAVMVCSREGRRTVLTQVTALSFLISWLERGLFMALTMEAVSTTKTCQYKRDCTAQHRRKQSSSGNDWLLRGLQAPSFPDEAVITLSETEYCHGQACRSAPTTVYPSSSILIL
jgi:hypothetical protein